MGKAVCDSVAREKGRGGDFRKRKEILEKEKKDRLREAKERVAQKRREAQALLRPNDYAKKVQANNKVRIGNPKRYRRFDKYPDPRAKAERVQARKGRVDAETRGQEEAAKKARKAQVGRRALERLREGGHPGDLLPPQACMDRHPCQKRKVQSPPQ